MAGVKGERSRGDVMVIKKARKKSGSEVVGTVAKGR